MSGGLDADDFPAFFHAVHGHDPFPWQIRLAQQVFAKGWPKALDVPTGAGKTAAIDIAVFHLALEAHRGPLRQAPVRILFVVDRRLIVDDAYGRAKKISSALASAGDGVLARIGCRLRLLAENAQQPLAAARLRGGAPKEPDWVRTPAQPTVVVSTVDQVGSRMLFRGYGVSDTMKPIHAGLLGSDALLLLDEAHLSQAFVQTARDARMFQDEGPWSADASRAPFAIVTLSATQTDETGPLVLKDDYEHPVLGPRLNRTKSAELIKSEAKADDHAFAQEFAKRAWTLSKVGGGTASVVAVVVNRVKRARSIFDELEKLGARPLVQEQVEGDHSSGNDESSDAPADLALLIGRARELDRRELLRDLLPRIRAGRQELEAGRSLFIVATQCVEAGADLDFDALVTEIAPLDCLRQRFGRLNRMGRDIEGRAAILAAMDQVAKSAKPDPIYGDAMKLTWDLLNEKSEVAGKGKNAKSLIDFGIEASGKWLPGREALSPYLAPRAEAPVLLPRDVALWSRTSPVPAVDPEVSLYLHGPHRGPGDVEIVWRADLNGDARLDDENLKDCVRVCPPSALEALAVPISEARRWLRGDAEGDVSDVEAAGDEEDSAKNESRRRVLRWRGVDDLNTRLISAAHVRPGDVLVVPAEWGGCDRWGWAPEKNNEVPDKGEEANEKNRGRLILRLSPVLLARATANKGLGEELSKARSERLRDLCESLKESRDRDIPAAIGDFTGLPMSWKQRFDRLGDSPLVERAADGRPLALEARKRVVMKGGDSGGGEAVTEDNDSTRASERPVHLDRHCQGVRDRARRFAEQIGLKPALVEDLALSAYLHDGGKAHPAFRRLLYGGAELAALGGPPLAKSRKSPSGRRAWAEACRRAGLPKGARHEVASLAFAELHPTFAQAHDPELVLWLIGTHHGYGRPFFPAVDWPGEDTDVIEADLGDGLICAKTAQSLAQLTAQWIDLFGRLQARYGPWGLVRLEAILRLADHRQSEAEQTEGERDEAADGIGKAEHAA